MQSEPEAKNAFRRDGTTCAIAIAERRGNPDDPFISRSHELQCFGETRNELLDNPCRGDASLVAAVERLAGDELAFIIEADRIPSAGMRPGLRAGANDEILKTAGRRDHIFRGCVAREKVGAGQCRRRVWNRRSGRAGRRMKQK